MGNQVCLETNFGNIEILSSDNNESLTQIGLSGFGDARVITVNPVDVEYGIVRLGCDNEERITVVVVEN